MTRALVLVGLTALAAVTLLWPALYNGGFFWFADSISYLSGASRGLESALGLESEVGAALNATGDINNAPPIVAEAAATAGGAAAEPQPRTVQGGRSIYYGLLLYLPTFLGSLWLSIFLQTGLFIAAFLVALRPVFRGAGEYALGIVAILGAATSASFFVVYLMPDIFMAVMVLAFASLMAFWREHGWAARLFLIALILASCVFHKAHIAVLFCTLCLYAVAHILFAQNFKKLLAPGAVTVATLALAVAMTAAVPMAIERFLGAKTLDPPFAMVRVITDGPGESYLRENCPELGHLLCDHLEKLPQGMDEFLWAPHGVYKALTPAEKIRLGEGQLEFILASVQHDPGAQFVATLGNVIRQVVSFDVTEFAVFDQILDAVEERLPPDIGQDAVNSRIAGHVFPLEFVSMVQAVIVIGSGLYVLYVVVMDTQARRAVREVEGLRPFLYILAMALVFNAGISGAVSEPHDRYQARIIWLIPLTSLIILFTSYKAQGLLPFLSRSRA